MKIVFSFLLLFSVTFCFADAWDDLSLPEANEVIRYLHKNPFIFDYCDCCDGGVEDPTDVYLLKVLQADIIHCSWKKGKYSVEVKAEVLGQVPYSRGKLNFANLLKAPFSEMDEYTVTMNYTWGYNASKKMATPLFDIIPYNNYDDDPNPCNEYENFPFPAKVNKEKNYIAYTLWYEKNHR